MSIADGMGIGIGGSGRGISGGGFITSSEHELLKMFWMFCCKVFEYRESILSPIAEMEMEIAGAGLYSVDASASDGSETAPTPSSTTTTAAAATSAPASPESASIKAAAQNAVQHQDKASVIHKSMTILLKSMLENERMAVFRKSSREVIYAMAAMADEVFLNMDWGGKHFWEGHMLETQFFDTQIAGDEIFTRITEVLEQKDAIGTEKAEIYLDMLMLGFKGRFRETEEENTEINMYKNKLFNFITRRNREEVLGAENRLFQKQYDYTMPTVRRKLLPDGGIVTYIATCFLVIFLGVSTIVWLVETMELSRLLNEISNMVLRGH